MIEIKLRGCKIQMWPEYNADYMQTAFPDGAVVGSEPNYVTDPTDPYKASQAGAADALGYGEGREAIRAFWISHDVCHSLVAEQQGLAASRTLWATAHEGWQSLPYGVLGSEEVLVPAVQLWVMTGRRRRGRMDVLSDDDLAEIKARLEQVLALIDANESGAVP